MGSDARHKERQELYQSRQWKDLRKKLQMERPLCENCLKKGIIKPMEECHHKLSPFAPGITEEEKYRRAFDEKNILCLCKECHIREHHPDGTIQDKILKYSD